jgi:hypothetical protein
MEQRCCYEIARLKIKNIGVRHIVKLKSYPGIV